MKSLVFVVCILLRAICSFLSFFLLFLLFSNTPDADHEIFSSKEEYFLDDDDFADRENSGSHAPLLHRGEIPVSKSDTSFVDTLFAAVRLLAGKDLASTLVGDGNSPHKFGEQDIGNIHLCELSNLQKQCADSLDRATAVSLPILAFTLYVLIPHLEPVLQVMLMFSLGTILL